MGVAYQPGQVLDQNDLKINIRDGNGDLTDPYYIRYSIFDRTTGLEVLIGSLDRVPATIGIGQYYANFTVPLDANIGDWIIRWNFRETVGCPLVEAVQEFNVVSIDTTVSITGSDTGDLLIRRLRIILRDNNPDRNYRFRPPASERFIQAQAQVFGYIWEDEELYEYLLMAIDDFNTAPPITGVTINDVPDRWRTAIILRAGAFACFAITMNWIADEFDYSVSGISLSIEKSGKYQGMKENFISEYDKLKDQAKRSIKIVKGLKQPRYGIGISSALGPYSRPGIQSRRNYVSGARGGWS